MNRCRGCKYRAVQLLNGTCTLCTWNRIKTWLVVDRSLEARNNLEILGLIGILPFTGDLDITISSLLLCLSNSNPLLGREMLAKFRECVGSQAQPLEEGTVLNGVKDNVVIGAVSIRLWRLSIKYFKLTYRAKYNTPNRSMWAWSAGGACTRWILDFIKPPVSAVKASHVLMVMVPSWGLTHFHWPSELRIWSAATGCRNRRVTVPKSVWPGL